MVNDYYPTSHFLHSNLCKLVQIPEIEFIKTIFINYIRVLNFVKLHCVLQDLFIKEKRFLISASQCRGLHASNCWPTSLTASGFSDGVTVCNRLTRLHFRVQLVFPTPLFLHCTAHVQHCRCRKPAFTVTITTN